MFLAVSGWYLVDLRSLKDTSQYFGILNLLFSFADFIFAERLKQSPPVHRIHIECYHTTTMAVTNTRGSIFTRSQVSVPLRPKFSLHICRSKKEVTYCDHMDFPLTSWSDLSEWPHLETLANQGASIIGVNMQSKVEPGDLETREAFEAFKNKFVQQNCHRDVEIR